MPVCCEMREDLGLELGIAKASPEVVAGSRQRVEIARRRQLGGLERVLGRRPADDDTEVIRRAGRGAERADLLVDPLGKARGVEQRLRLLEEQALVGRAAALGDEQELVLVAVDRRSILISAGRLVPVFTSSHMSSGAICE